MQASLVRGPLRWGRLRKGRLLLAPGAWLGMLLSLYGAFGLVALAFFPAVSPVWPALCALGLTLPVALGMECYLRADNAAGLSAVRDDSYIAKVTVPIPAHGRGTVAFSANGRRVIRPAQSADGRAIPRSATVLVLSLRRDIVVVEALDHRES